MSRRYIDAADATVREAQRLEETVRRVVRSVQRLLVVAERKAAEAARQQQEEHAAGLHRKRYVSSCPACNRQVVVS